MFANEAKEAAELKQRTGSSSGSRAGDESFRPSTSSSLADHDMSYEELKQKYNTLNERELQEIIAKNKEKRDAGSSSSGGGASPLPAQQLGGEGRPTIDRSLKPHLQLQQSNKYNLRTVSKYFAKFRNKRFTNVGDVKKGDCAIGHGQEVSRDRRGEHASQRRDVRHTGGQASPEQVHHNSLYNTEAKGHVGHVQHGTRARVVCGH